MSRKARTRENVVDSAKNYDHVTAESLMRPDVGTQPQFRKTLPPKKYRYDDSLAPELEWDENAARERGEALIDEALAASKLDEAKTAIAKLKAMSRPFLNWAGKAERLSFDVPTLPLFIHERLSTKAILETLKGHKRDKRLSLLDLFADPEHSIADQILRAYEHYDRWVNRMILGDSLVVMNSLLQYEGLGNQVQMIYFDPPYGVKFGSNFQPFVRDRQVSENNDDDMTREPEMVQAYRDTWSLGLHSYLTYLRDRLTLANELLTWSGSIFVQISDDNLHHVREVMDEVFGRENFVSQISFFKTGSQTDRTLAANCDFLLWYAKDIKQLKFRKVYVNDGGWAARSMDIWVEYPDGARERKRAVDGVLPEGSRLFAHRSLQSATPSEKSREPFSFEGQTYYPKRGWSTSTDVGMPRLAERRRIIQIGKGIRFIVYLDDFPYSNLTTVWSDTGTGSFLDPNIYVVQTASKVVQRCIQMTTEPGDLVLDPTCGSGTTAYVAEQWGRRWITIDASRVPLALARQRLLTATFDWYELQDDVQGPASGFVYKQKQNQKGEEVGGIVPHPTLKNIANDEPPEEVVLVDRPEVRRGVTRVTGPFTVEATIPTPHDIELSMPEAGSPQEESGQPFIDRMLEILRRSPVLQIEGGRKATLKNVKPLAKSLSLSAEAIMTNGKEQLAALIFGPENGAVSERLVFEAAKEANARNYQYLFVVGFAIQPEARLLINRCHEVAGIVASYVQVSPDVMMGDLLKNMRSSQIFSVCGSPDVKLTRVKEADSEKYQVELLGVDIFDPVNMQPLSRKGEDVPAWFLDTNYNGLCFHVSQAFFPRTGAWDSLEKALGTEFEDTVWDHLAGSRSAPFPAEPHDQVAIKVIDDRGNELMVVKNISDAE